MLIRNLMGESLNSMSLRDLKQLETRLEKGINKIRTKKANLFKLCANLFAIRIMYFYYLHGLFKKMLIPHI